MCVLKKGDDAESQLQCNLIIAAEELDLFSVNDPDWDHSFTVRGDLLTIAYSHKEMFREKKKHARQSSLGEFFKKQPKISLG